MKRAIVFFILGISLSGCASMPVQQRILVSMARLDRVYIIRNCDGALKKRMEQI
jgi:hypothetical protein